MARIAVVMSTHNDERYIKEAVESIQNQTVKDWYFFVFDDCSSDDTYKVLSEYEKQDDRIMVFQNKENIGLPASLNLVRKYLDSTYTEVLFVARMDGDDLSDPERFAKQLHFLYKNQDHGMVGSWYYVINELNQVTNRVTPFTESDKIKANLYFHNQFGHGSVIFRKDCINKVGWYDERFLLCQDYDLYLRTIKKYEVANLPKFLISWRVHSGNNNPDKFKQQCYYTDLARYKNHCEHYNVNFNINSYYKTE